MSEPTKPTAPRDETIVFPSKPNEPTPDSPGNPAETINLADSVPDGPLPGVSEMETGRNHTHAGPAPGVGTIDLGRAAGDPGGTIDHAPVEAPPVGAATIDGTPSAVDTDVGFVVNTQPGKGRIEGITVPGYEVLDELGRGAMGVVYKARQIRLDRLVALKMVLSGAHAGPEQLARFATEGQAVAKIQHPNIVQIYEVGEHDGLPYFSLEYVNGGSLSDRIKGKPQPPAEAAHVTELLALAMASAHGLGVIHRDLKPANVLMTTEGLPKISDFGLAKRLEEDSGQTKSGTLMGTPSYMAPEQARGDTKDVGPLADVYALGVILYELLTGRTPFVGVSILDTLQLVRNQEPLPPSRLQPKIPRDLDTICLKCLQKEPAKRYPSADDLADDLHRYLAGEPIKARPVGRVERVWRWCKRNPRVAALSGLAAGLAVTAGVFLSVLYVRNANERQTMAEAGKLAGERIEQAVKAIRTGAFRQAQEVLRSPDTLLETKPALEELREQHHRLRDQVNLYADFKELLDQSRYYGLFGPKGGLQEAQKRCQELLALYDEIDQQTGRAACGLPPLNPPQEALFRDDFFEAFLIAAQVEWELVRTAPAPSQKAAAEKAVAWLDRAAKIHSQPLWVLYSRRAMFRTKLGDAARAKEDSGIALKLQPSTPLDRFWFGFDLHLQGQALREKDAVKAEPYYRRALEEYALVVREQPDHFWAYYDGATCQFQLGNLSEAITGFTTCIHIRPELAWPYNNRGAILAQQKRYALAVEDLSAALERQADFVEALTNRGLAYANLEKADLAFADFDRASEINPSWAAVHVHRAETYRMLKRFPEALPHYEKALALEPENAEVYANRGKGYLAAADLLHAQADLAKAFELQPRDVDVCRFYGVTSLRLSDFAAAHRAWQALAKLTPASEQPFYNDAITYKFERNYDEAVKAVDRAIAVKPTDSNAYLMRAQLYHQVGKLKEALADQLVVLNKLRDHKGEIFNDHGDLLRTMNKFPEAAAAYQQSLKLLPKQTDAYAGLALALWLDGKADAASAALDQAVAANPVNPRAYLRRAEMHRNRGAWKEAWADCEQAAKLDPKSPLPGLVKASLLAAQGKFREGAAQAEAILAAQPPDGYVLATAASAFSLASQEAGKHGGDAKLAKEYSDRAAGLLSESLTKGAFLGQLNFQAVNRMLADPALTAVRQHPVVLELLPVLRPDK